jgi:hypothetical protein
MKLDKNSPLNMAEVTGAGKSPMQTMQTHPLVSSDGVPTEVQLSPSVGKIPLTYTPIGDPSLKIGKKNMQTAANDANTANCKRLPIFTLLGTFNWAVRHLEEAGFLSVCKVANEYRICLQTSKWTWDNGFKLQTEEK